MLIPQRGCLLVGCVIFSWWKKFIESWKNFKFF